TCLTTLAPPVYPIILATGELLRLWETPLANVAHMGGCHAKVAFGRDHHGTAVGAGWACPRGRPAAGQRAGGTRRLHALRGRYLRTQVRHRPDDGRVYPKEG